MLGGIIDKHDSRKKLFVAPGSRSARRSSRTPATCKLIIIRRESQLEVVAFNRADNTGELEGKAATGGPGPPFQPRGALHILVPTVSWTCNRDSTLVIGAHYVRPYRRWRVAINRAMSWISTTKSNHLSPGASITLVVSCTPSVTRKLDHINLHRFWT